MLVQTLIVPVTLFDHDKLRRLFLDSLETDGKNYPVMKIEVFTDPEAALGNFKGSTDIAYDAWRRMFDDYKTRTPQSAQLVSINGNASMRVRGKLGEIYTTVLSGQDPNILVIKSTNLHLADFHARTLRVGRVGRPVLELAFYYWTPDRYNELTVKEALDERVATTGIPGASVSVEPSPWFIYQEEFPILYPYSLVKEPPNEQEYNSTFRPTCSTVFGSHTCFSFGKKPDDDMPGKSRGPKN
ncbi:MAG TPA: hypothetical protein VIX89_02385 [Bryobacteraceae bacterium]